MIVALLSSKEIKEDALRRVISKKLDSVNNLQTAVGKDGEIVVYPLDYPASISTMIRALSVADSFVFVLNEEVAAVDAEIALAIENSELDNGAVLCSDYSDMTTFSKFFNGYKLGRTRTVTEGDIRFEKKATRKSEGSYVSIDKHFIVKGIGTVVLGFNLGGDVKKGEHLHLVPSMKEVAIKSIQVMDLDVQSAPAGEHVGLALNNVTDSDLENNYALSSKAEITDALECRLSQSAFYKADPSQSKGLAVAVLGRTINLNLQHAGDKFTAKFNKPIIRLKTSAILVDASLAVGKNRVIGRLEFI